MALTCQVNIASLPPEPAAGCPAAAPWLLFLPPRFRFLLLTICHPSAASAASSFTESAPDAFDVPDTADLAVELINSFCLSYCVRM